MKLEFAGSVPRCFETKEQFVAWREAARLAYAHYGPCTDCTPEYQARMKEENRCEQPQVVFVVQNGGVEGVIPSKQMTFTGFEL